MSAKKDNRKVMDMLEKMGMFKGSEVEEGVSSAFLEEDAAFTEAPAQAEPDILPPPVSSRPFAPDVSPVRTGRSFADGMLDKSFWDDDAPDQKAEPDEFHYLSVDELYQSFRMKQDGVDTIYLIEDYMRTLPESLPAEMRRSIVLKIVSASGFDFDRLLNDGIERVSKLNEYSASFAARTEELLSGLNGEIEQLQGKIEAIRQTMNERKNLHKRQFVTIESEAQRLKEILDFITK